MFSETFSSAWFTHESNLFYWTLSFVFIFLFGRDIDQEFYVEQRDRIHAQELTLPSTFFQLLPGIYYENVAQKSVWYDYYNRKKPRYSESFG